MWNVDNFNGNLLELQELSKENYGDQDVVDINFINWQYEQNPAGKAIIKLARDKDELVGQYVVAPVRIKKESKIEKATLSLNTLTKSSHRGQGIFTGLAEAVYAECINNDLMYTYGFPNQNSYPGFIRKLSFKNIGVVPLLLKPLDSCEIIKNKISKFISPVGYIINIMFKEKTVDENKFSLLRVNDNNVEIIDKIWDKVKDKYKIIGVRDAEFIKWRYIDIPLRKYEIIAVLDKNNEAVGYIVGRCMDVSGIKCGMIADFIFASDEIYGRALINSILQYFRINNVSLVGCLMLKGKQEYKTLRDNNFYKCPRKFEPQPFPVIFRPHVPNHEQGSYEDLNNWFLTMGDYDVI